MVLGYFLVNYTSLADGKLTKQANAIVFKIFLPCMLFYNVYQSDIGSEIHSRIRLCIWAAGGLLIQIILDIIKNPLIISSVLGIIFSLLGIRLPTAVDTTVQDLAKLSTPIAFMILGGDLDFSKVKGNLKTASVVLTIKLVILPLIMIPMVVMMGYRDADLLSGLLAYQTPVAVSSYIMAQQAGADGQLAGQLVVFSSVLSIFTLFVTIFILRTVGLLGI